MKRREEKKRWDGQRRVSRVREGDEEVLMVSEEENREGDSEVTC